MKGLSHRRCIGGSSPIISSLGGVGPAGYAEGRNVSIEFRSADGRPERFPELMSELVRLGVDVILHVGPEASLRAAQEATTAVPIARWPSSRSAPRRHLSAQGAVGTVAGPWSARAAVCSPARFLLHLHDAVQPIRKRTPWQEPASRPEMQNAPRSAEASTTTTSSPGAC
jgi:hypothetical protein